MERDEEFFLECKGYNFVCKYLKEKYPKEYYMTLFRDACVVLKDCTKNNTPVDTFTTVPPDTNPSSKVV